MALPTRRLATLTEQGVLSLANFVGGVFSARALEKREFGSFGLAFAALMFMQGFQRAYVVLPMISFSATREGLLDSGRLWDNAQVRNIGFTCGPLLLLWCAGRMLGFADAARTALLAALLIPFFFGYEYVRRWLLLEGKVFYLVPMSLVYAALYLIALHEMIPLYPHALVMVAAMALASALACAIGLMSRTSPEHAPEATVGAKPDISRFGRHAAASHLAFSFYTTLIQLLLGWITGPAAVAVMTATRNLVQPVQTLINAVDSMDKPRAAAALHQGGRRGLSHSLQRTLRFLLLLGGGYIFVVAVAGANALNLFYGTKYRDNVAELWLWLGVYSLMLIGQPLESGLYVLKRTDLLWRGRVAAAIAAAVAAIILLRPYGAIGAIVCMGIGWAVSCGFAFAQLRSAMGSVA